MSHLARPLDDALAAHQLDDDAALADAEPMERPAKRARPTLELPECPVCIDVAVPPVIFECDHIACGPCTRRLEAPRPARAGGFQCPTCRAAVRLYSVPVVFRQQALAVASAEQRAADAAFMREYTAAPRPQAVNKDAAPRRAARAPSVVDRAAVQAKFDQVVGMIPRQLQMGRWTHDGDRFTLRLNNVFEVTAAFNASSVRSLQTRLRRLLQRGGMALRCDGTCARITVAIEDVERFAAMPWPGDPPAVV